MIKIRRAVRLTSTSLLVAFVLLFAVVAVARAQDAATTGAGKVEIGLYPIGATFLVGGDDNKEVNFNVYTAGANLTYYVNRRVAVEGELTISFGLAQDVFFNKAEVLHVQMPNVWSYSGNVVFFPGGAAGQAACRSTSPAASARLPCIHARRLASLDTTRTRSDSRRSWPRTSAAA